MRLTLSVGFGGGGGSVVVGAGHGIVAVLVITMVCNNVTITSRSSTTYLRGKKPVWPALLVPSDQPFVK